MKSIKFIIYKEGNYYVSQCLNVDVSSFGDTIEDSKKNLQEALDLYFEDESAAQNFTPITETLLGELNI